MAEDTRSSTTTIDIFGNKGGTHIRRSSILKPARAPLDEVDQNFQSEATEKRRSLKRVSFSGTTDIKIYERYIFQAAEKPAASPGNVVSTDICVNQVPKSGDDNRADIAGLLKFPIRKDNLNSGAEKHVESELVMAQHLEDPSLHMNCTEDAMSMTMVTEHVHSISTHQTRMLDDNMPITMLSGTGVTSPVGTRTVHADVDIEETCLEKSFAYIESGDKAGDDMQQRHAQMYQSPEQAKEKLYALPLLQIIFPSQEKQHGYDASPRIMQEQHLLHKTTVQEVTMSVTTITHYADNRKQDLVEEAGEEGMEQTCFEKSFACFNFPVEDNGSAEIEVFSDGGIDKENAVAAKPWSHLPDGPTKRSCSGDISSLEEISPISSNHISQRLAISAMEDQPSVFPGGGKDFRLQSTMIGEMECTSNIRAALRDAQVAAEKGTNVRPCVQQTPATGFSPEHSPPRGATVPVSRFLVTADVEDAHCSTECDEKEKCLKSRALQSCMDITDIGDGDASIEVEAEKGDCAKRSELVSDNLLKESDYKCPAAGALQAENRDDLPVTEDASPACGVFQCSAKDGKVCDSVCEKNMHNSVRLEFGTGHKTVVTPDTENIAGSSPVMPSVQAQSIETSPPEHFGADVGRENYKCGDSLAVSSQMGEAAEVPEVLNIREDENREALPPMVLEDSPSNVSSCAPGKMCALSQLSQGAFPTETLKTCFTDMQITCLSKEPTVDKCISKIVHNCLQEAETDQNLETVAVTTAVSAVQYTEEIENVFPKLFLKFPLKTVPHVMIDDESDVTKPCTEAFVSAHSVEQSRGEPDTSLQRKSATFMIPSSRGSSVADALAKTGSKDCTPEMSVLHQRKSATFTVPCTEGILTDSAATDAAHSDAQVERSVQEVAVKALDGTCPLDAAACLLNRMNAGSPVIQQKSAVARNAADKPLQPKICATARPVQQEKSRAPTGKSLTQVPRNARVAPSATKQTRAAVVETSVSASRCTPMMTRCSSRLKTSSASNRVKRALCSNTPTKTPESITAPSTECSQKIPSSKGGVSPPQKVASMTRSSSRQLQTLKSSNRKVLTLAAAECVSYGSVPKKVKLNLPKRPDNAQPVPTERGTVSTPRKYERNICQMTPRRVPLRSSSCIKELQNARMNSETKLKTIPAAEKGSSSPAHKLAKLSAAKKNRAKESPLQPVDKMNAAHERINSTNTTEVVVPCLAPASSSVALTLDVEASAARSVTATVHLDESLLSGIAEMTHDSIDVPVQDELEDIDGELDLTVGTDELLEKLLEPTAEDLLQMFFWGAYDISESDREFVVEDVTRDSAQFFFSNGKTRVIIVLEGFEGRTPALGEKVPRIVKNIKLVPMHSSTPISQFLHKVFMAGVKPSSMPLLCKTNDDISDTLKFLCRASYKCRCFAQDYLAAVTGNTYLFDADYTLRTEFLCERKGWWFFVTFKLDYETYPNAVMCPKVEVMWGPERLPQDIEKITRQVRPGKMYLSRLVREIPKALHISTFEEWFGSSLSEIQF